MRTNNSKSNYCNENGPLTAIVVAGCAQLAAQIETAKDQVAAEYGGRLAGHEAVLRLALNEAEALAWETNYPHLVFATLAMEKAQAAATWENRQQLLTRHRPPLATPVAATLDHV